MALLSARLEEDALRQKYGKRLKRSCREGRGVFSISI
jgi:hypothetical protein